MDRLLKIIEDMGLPFAYSHFAEGESPDPPFLVYLFPKNKHFGADGVVFYKNTQIDLELYTDKKDLKLEEKIEEILDREKIYYEKSEVWIESERLYEVLYEFTLNLKITEVNNNVNDLTPRALRVEGRSDVTQSNSLRLIRSEENCDGADSLQFMGGNNYGK